MSPVPPRPAFRRDLQLDALLLLRETDPAAWRALPAWQKITLACYEGSRAYAEHWDREYGQAGQYERRAA